VQVDVVERRHRRVVAPVEAEQLERAVGQHLVHVHVGAGAGPALEGIHDDGGGERAVHQLAGGLFERRRHLVRQVAERPVGAHRRHLDRSVRARQRRVNRPAKQLEVVDRPFRVDAVQPPGRNATFTQGVPFAA
jgi:hypothetical protein